MTNEHSNSKSKRKNVGTLDRVVRRSECSAERMSTMGEAVQ